MATNGGPKIVNDGLLLNLDAANIKSFRGEPTTNTINFSSVGATRYNNTGFNGSITNTGLFFKGSPIWEATFIPQNSTILPRLGTTDGFGFYHSMGIPLQPNTDYMASIYFKTDNVLAQTATQGFINTYSNITGWGQSGTANTRLFEDGWTRLYTKYNNTVNIGGTNYSFRGNFNTFSAVVNTTQTTEVLVSLTIQSNGTFQTTTDYGTNTLGGGLADFTNMVGIYNASPSITSTGGISGMTTGTGNILQHGLNNSTWTKLSASNTILKSSFPTTYYILLNVPSTGGVNATIQFRTDFTGYYTALTDNKFWKITFDTTNLAVNQVLKTYWAAPMIEQHSRNLPSNFVIGTRGTTVANGGGWADRSGNGFHGELVNGLTYNNEKKGSLVLDGTDDVILTNLVLPSPNTTPTTFEVIFKNNSTSTFKGLIGASAYQSSGFSVGFIGQSIIRLTYNAPTLSYEPQVSYDSSVITIGTFIFNGRNLSIYRNGVLLSSVTASFDATQNNNAIRIGSNLQGGWTTAQANIYSVKVYNRALSAQEVIDNFNAKKGRYGL